MKTNSPVLNFLGGATTAAAMALGGQGEVKGQEPAFPKAYQLRTIPAQVLGTNPLPPIVKTTPAQMAAAPIVPAGITYQLDPDNKEDKEVIALLEGMYTTKGLDLDKTKPSIISFSTHWCPPCKILEPLLAQVKKDQAQDNFLKNFNIVTFKSTKPSEANEYGSVKVNNRDFPKEKDAPEFSHLAPLADKFNNSFPRTAEVFKQNGRWTIKDLTKAVQSKIVTNNPKQITEGLKNALNGAIDVHKQDSKIK